MLINTASSGSKIIEGGKIMREDVLKIEFQPVFDKWAWKVTKNKLDPGFEFEYLKNGNANIIRLNFGFVIDERYLINDSEKEKLEKSIKAINEKYGILKRWRAEKNGKYYFVEIEQNANIILTVESSDLLDDERYKSGNYFQTREHAEKYLSDLKEFNAKWHEENGADGNEL